jgi:cell shape-determining protein MreC
MTINDWLALILTSLSILAIIGVSIRWVIRHYLKDVLAEFKPNGGSTLKDQVNRLENDISDLKNQNLKGEEYHERLDSKVDNLTELIIKYIARQK